MTTSSADHQERIQLLSTLEAIHARGIQALSRRNSLLVELHEDGESLQSLASIINEAREHHGVRPVTRQAVYVAISRHAGATP